MIFPLRLLFLLFVCFFKEFQNTIFCLYFFTFLYSYSYNKLLKYPQPFNKYCIYPSPKEGNALLSYKVIFLLLIIFLTFISFFFFFFLFVSLYSFVILKTIFLHLFLFSYKSISLSTCSNIANRVCCFHLVLIFPFRLYTSCKYKKKRKYSF